VTLQEIAKRKKTQVLFLVPAPEIQFFENVLTRVPINENKPEVHLVGINCNTDALDGSPLLSRNHWTWDKQFFAPADF